MANDGKVGLPESHCVSRVLKQQEVDVKSDVTRHWMKAAVLCSNFTTSCTLKQVMVC